MIDPEPVWTRRFETPPSQWCSHVWLDRGLAIGQWQALERASGATVWARELPEANKIEGITAGVILATRVADGRAQLGGRGCHALELSSGALLWSKPASADGWWRRRSGVAPSRVEASELVCMDGAVFDVRSGELTRRVAAVTKYPGKPWRPSEADALYDTLASRERVAVGPDHELGHAPHGDGPLFHGLRGAGRDGAGAWRFDLSSTGYHAGSSHYDHRLVSPYFYYLVAEAPLMEPLDPGNDKFIRWVTSERHLLTLDTRTGALVQDVALGEWTQCSIQDADAQGMLLSFDKTELSYFSIGS